MAKITFTYNGDWPIMQPLGAKETALRNQNMTKGEQLLGQVIGSFGQAVIATTQKVLIVKTGLMAGQTFGGKAHVTPTPPTLGVSGFLSCCLPDVPCVS